MMKGKFRRLKLLLVVLCSACLLFANLTAYADQIVTYVHTDRLGNPAMETDSTGAVIWRQSYTPYGETPEQADPDGPGFTGHRHDQATGLVYMQARYYDPKIGRFLSPDPVTFSPDQPQQFNRYWYAQGNPYKYTDPDGRCGCVLVPLVIIAIAATQTPQGKHATASMVKAVVAATKASGHELAHAAGAILHLNEASSPEQESDDAVAEVTKGARPARGAEGKKAGHLEKPGGNAEADRDGMPGTMDKGVKTLPDWSKVHVHSSKGGKDVAPGTKTLVIKRPKGKQNIKQRYPDQ